MRTYYLDGLGSFEGIVARDAPEPTPGPTGIVVRVRAVALNRRDVAIVNGTYPLPSVPGVIPVSDGAGEVVAVGPEVTRFRVGDRVVGSYFAKWLDGRLNIGLIDQLGCTLDGMLTEYALLDQDWAALVPDHLTWAEAASLPCSGTTAWNSLTGGEPLLPGQTVLTLGTGAVSLAAVQFAKLMGATVISTTSSDAKGDRLRALGADHVVNYATTPDWGRAVRELTGGAGVDLVVETNGPKTIEQSMRAAGLYGQVVLLITGSASRPGIEISNAAYASSMATIRRVFVGSRAHLETMLAAVAAHGLRPVVDREFDYDDVHEAYRYFDKASGFGKVVVRVG
ncbi:NAD(P)-dependent alcohol dehydrogenase [Longispora sp. K20-0274]|uniref:zinc-dependent alcohol dehydrogenase family protein n=1 Tax=Longispora sp. K20-0274 TaxID=3088255 RepID=UPI00399A5585